MMASVKEITVMANTFAPFGFKQASGNGSAPTYEQLAGTIAVTTAPVFFGDPVGRLAVDGTLAGATTSTLPGTDAIAGVFVGCKYLSVSQKRTVWSNYWPGTDSVTPVEAYYVNDPNAKFLVQTDGNGAPAATIGANIQFAYGTGNTSNGISGAYVLGASAGVTSTLPFRVVGYYVGPPGSNGTFPGGYQWVIVAFNNVETKSLTAV
jgi:hypothetical protein